MADTRHTIYIVDDDLSLRTALSRLLRAAGYGVQTYASAGEFLLAALARSAQSLPIVFLTGNGDIPMSVRAMRAGAVDFLTKPVRRDDLLHAVETALARDAQRRAISEQQRTLRARYELLTAREREVFGLVVAGLLNKQVAAELGCSIRTVKIHRARAMEKIQAASLADMVRAAVALGIAPPPTAPLSDSD